MSQLRARLKSLRDEVRGEFLTVTTIAVRFFIERTWKNGLLSGQERTSEVKRLAKLAFQADCGGFSECEATELCLLCAAVPASHPCSTVAMRARAFIY